MTSFTLLFFSSAIADSMGDGEITEKNRNWKERGKATLKKRQKMFPLELGKNPQLDYKKRKRGEEKMLLAFQDFFYEK